MKRPMIFLAGLLVSAVAGAGIFDGPLRGTDTARYLKNASALGDDAALVPSPESRDAMALRLRFDNQQFAEFHPVPVRTDRAYVLSFRGRWVNQETLETNPTFAAALTDSWETALRALPTAVIEFLDAEQTALPQRVVSAMPSGQWADYRQAFVPPPGAVSMQLKVKSGDNAGEFLVLGPALSVQPEAANTLIMSFRQDHAAVRGRIFGALLDGACRKTGNGLVLVNSGSGMRTSVFALGEPGNYRLAVTGEPQEKPRITLTLQDAGGKKTGEAVLSKPQQKSTDFTVTQATVGAQLVVQGYWLDEIRIQRLP